MKKNWSSAQQFAQFSRQSVGIDREVSTGINVHCSQGSKVQLVQARQRVFSFCVPEEVSDKYIQVYTRFSHNFARNSMVLFIYASDRYNFEVL